MVQIEIGLKLNIAWLNETGKDIRLTVNNQEFPPSNPHEVPQYVSFDLPHNTLLMDVNDDHDDQKLIVSWIEILENTPSADKHYLIVQVVPSLPIIRPIRNEVFRIRKDNYILHLGLHDGIVIVGTLDSDDKPYLN